MVLDNRKMHGVPYKLSLGNLCMCWDNELEGAVKHPGGVHVSEQCQISTSYQRGHCASVADLCRRYLSH